MSRWLVYPGNRPFRWLWWSQTVSMFGSQVSLVAIPLLAAISLRADAFQMGLLIATETGAYLLVSVPAGIVTDRVDRRRLLITSNLGRAVLLLVIPAGAALGWLSLPLLYVVAAGVGVCSAVFDVAYQSYLPELLPPQQLLDGNQRVEISESAARTLGPGLAGGLIAAFGGAVAITVDALSYLVASVALLGAARPTTIAALGASGIPRASAADQSSASAPPAADDGLSAGFKIVLRDRILRDTAISTAIFNLASSAILAVFILFAARELGLDATSIGIIVGLSNVGFVVGALTVGVVTTRLGIGWTLTVAALLGGLGTVLLPFATGPFAIFFLCAGRFTGAVAIPWFNVNARSFRQARAPLSALGRVNAVFRLIDWGTLPIGALLGGWIGTTFGLHTTLAVGALLGIASAAWLVASPVRRVRDLEMASSSSQPGSTSLAAARPRAPGLAVRVGARLAAIGNTSFRWSSLAIGGFALQLALFLPRVNIFGSATPALYVLSCVAVLTCVVANARIPGIAIMAVGGASNLLAIVANGGFMPVAAAAARAVGQRPPTGYVTTIEMDNPVLKPLTDIIIVTWPAPVANVYSIGDVLILVGLVVTGLWILRRPVATDLVEGLDDDDQHGPTAGAAVRVGT